MMLYKNTKIKVRLLDGDTDFFDIVARGHISPIPVYYLPRLRASNVDRFNEKNGFTLEKARSRRYPHKLLRTRTEYMCFNQRGGISILKDGSLKLVDKFTENNINTRLAKAWKAIDRLSVIWKSDLSDKIRRSFIKAAVVSILLYGCTT